jgi:hypothetical protein
MDDISGSLTYNGLAQTMREGFRNGNWRRLDQLERALYVASLSLAKMRGRLVNSRLILELHNIIGKLKEADGDRTTRVAYHRAARHYERFLAIGLFKWAPQVRSWFDDPSYISWLGLYSLS